MVALLAPAPAGATASRQQTAVPAYWGPDTPDGMAIFHRLAQNRPTSGIVVINGSRSMPELPTHPAWSAALARIRGSGAKALVYVDTGYHGIDFGHGSHPTRTGGTSIPEWSAQIRRDIDDWYANYQIDGIFLDQTILLCGTNNEWVELYSAIRDHIRAKNPAAYIVINPGAFVEQCYENVADTIVSFEGDTAAYLNRTPPAWQLDYPDPKKFWHLIHDVPNEDVMRTVIARSKENNAGFVYTTERTMNPFPWGGLASYWDSELVATAGIVDTTPPRAPANITATTRANAQEAWVRLAWQTPSDDVAVSRYEVYANGSLIGETYNNAFQAKGLPFGTMYTFSITARDAAGNASAPSAPLTIKTPSPGPAVTEPGACVSSQAAEYRAAFGSAFSHHRVFIDADNDPATGWHLPPGLPGGVDTLIENSYAYRYTGPGWAWTPAPELAPSVSESAGVLTWRVPVAGQSRQVVVFSGFTAEDPPDEYSQPITVEVSGHC